MRKSIQYLITDGIIKGILFSWVTILPISLNIFEILVFGFIILITVLSSIFTQKILKHSNKKFKENFYLIYISNLIAIMLIQGIKEFYTKFILIPSILNTNHNNVIATYAEFKMEGNYYYYNAIVVILLINFLISLVCASIISFSKITKEKMNKELN